MNATAAVETLPPSDLSPRDRTWALQRTTVIVAVLTVLGAVLRFAGIGHQSFWYDESFTVLLVHHSPSQMLGLLPQTELTPPLYYLLAWPWARVFGFGEAGLRSLSALAGVITIPVVYAAAAQLVSRRAGLVAAALTACNPLLIWYSQEARSYSLVVMFGSLSLLAFAYARVRGLRTRLLVAWAVAACLTLATHYYGILVVVPEAVWLLWVHRRDRRIYATVLAVAAFGGALLPIAVSQRPQASWIAPWLLNLRLQQIPTQFLLGTGAPARTVFELIGGVVVVLFAILLARGANAVERRGAATAGVVAISGLVISLILVAAGADELIARNVMIVLIPLIVLVSGGLGARRAGLLGLGGVAVLCAIGITAAVAVQLNTSLQRPDWRALTRALGAEHRIPGGRAILLQRNVFLMPLAIDVPGLHFIKPHGARVQEIDVVAAAVPRGGWFCWWGSACNLLSSQLDTPLHVRGFHRAGPVLHVNQFSVLRLRANAPIRLTPAEIARALNRAPMRVTVRQARDQPPGFGAPYSYGLFAQPPA